jgi:hypothetical protein
MRFNEMVIAPIISLFFVFLGNTDLFSCVSSALTCYNSWVEWIEYNEARLEVQRMFLITMATGGPHIVTNDPEYMPYVYADAVTRASLRQRPGRGQPGPLTHNRSQVRFLL